MVRGEGTVTWRTVLCLLLTLILYNTGLSDTTARPHLPHGCTRKNVTGGERIQCVRAAFKDVISACAVLGDTLVEITIGDCSPKPAVKLTSSTFNSSKLRKVGIFNCRVNDIADDALKKLANLRVLDLSSNEITRLKPKSFTGLHMLKELSVSINWVFNIDNNTFGELRQLTKLYLGQNRISKIGPNTFTGLVNLKLLSLKANWIGKTIINGTLYPLKKLEILNLGTNNLNSEIEENTFRGNRRLEELLLKGNDITFGSSGSVKLFKTLTRLRKLALTGSLTIISDFQLLDFLVDQANSLTDLDIFRMRFSNRHFIMLQYLKNLKYLRLVGNDIGFIQENSLPKLASLSEVLLERNKILYIDEKAFESLKAVTLYDNPFDCSCSLRSFSSWLRTRGNSSVVKGRKTLTCVGPVSRYGTKVIDYDPYWWTCSPYVPLVGLMFVIAFCLVVALIGLLFYCNRVNIRHFVLERREAAKVSDEEPVQPTTCNESDPLINNPMARNSLPPGKTGAYILYDMYEAHVLDWVNKYIEDELFNHPMRITVQWAAGPEVTPLWKQIKVFSNHVNYFLVIVTEEFLEKHWPDIAEKSGVENIMKCVLVLHGKKISELPKEIRRLKCPSFEWPQDGSGAQRKRVLFWKEIRLALKGTLK